MGIHFPLLLPLPTVLSFFIYLFIFLLYYGIVQWYKVLLNLNLNFRMLFSLHCFSLLTIIQHHLLF